MESYEYCSPTLNGCELVDNSASESGGGYAAESPGLLVNCLFVGNDSADMGGAVYDLQYSTAGRWLGTILPPVTLPAVQLINCTMTQNTAVRGGRCITGHTPIRR